jgi:hypothetical protein
MSHCLVVSINREGLHTIGVSTQGFATLCHKLYAKHIQLQELWSKKCEVGANFTNFMDHTPGIDALYVLIWLQCIYLPLQLFTKENFSSVTPLFCTTQHNHHPTDASRPSLGHKKIKIRCIERGVG